jgi:signal transduction histidine kinase
MSRWRRLRLVPDSIAGWMVATIVAGLVASQLLSLAVHYRERDAVMAALESFRIGERVADAINQIRRTPPDRRAEAAQRLTGPTMWVEWGPESALATEGRDWRVDMLKAAVSRELEEGAWRRLRIAEIDPAGLREVSLPRQTGALRGSGRLAEIARRLDAGPNFEIAVQLTDGSWLNFVVPFVGSLSYWSVELVAALALLIVIVIVLSLLAIRYITAPLSALARAAEQFGVNIDAAALPARGSREIRATIAAFNEMRQRIKRFLEDRMQMMAAISHDLRTPITRLRLRAEFIEDEEQQRKMLTDLDEMEAMISAVLSFAREEIVVEPQQALDLAALLDDICTQMRLQGHPVALALGDPIAFVGRPSALRRCFTNLVANALKYGGVARVSVERRGEDSVVVIEDDGPGIPEIEQERVFRPFYRLELSRSRDTGGTGLGLTVARTVARAHGGDIVLQNRAEGGLRVIVTLPTGGSSGPAQHEPLRRAAG